MRFREGYIPEGHEAIQRRVEKEHEICRGAYSFGRHALMLAEVIRDNEPVFGAETIEQRAERLQEWIKLDREKLAECAEFLSPLAWNMVVGFFANATDEGMREELIAQGIIEERTDGRRAVTDKGLDGDEIRSIPDDMMLRLLECRKKAFEKKEEELKEAVPHCIKLFVKRVMGSPISHRFSEEELQKRLSVLTFRLTDPLRTTEIKIIHGKNTLRKTTGVHQQKEVLIEVAMDLLNTKEQVITTLFHEFTHVIFGRALKHIEPLMESAAEEEKIFSWSDEVSPERIGLQFQPSIQGVRSHARFVWLNESVTEKYARSLFWFELPETHTSYDDEMQLTELLLTSGNQPISTDTLYEAATENVTTTEDNKGDPKLIKAVEWRKLSKAIREAYADGFLVRLDKYVTQYGAEKAVIKMREGKWREIHDQMGKPQPQPKDRA